MTDREALIAFNMVDGLGPVRVRELQAALGSPTDVIEADAEAWTQAKGLGPKLVDKVKAKLAQVDPVAEEAKALKLGARLVTQLDEDYPDALRTMHDPPLALYVKGTLVKADQHALSVVGSRRCTHYGTQVADRLSFQLAKQGYTVVSGLARGIDTAAHHGALKGGGRTIAVLGTGIDQIYPAEQVPLAERIIEQGALISEFPIGFRPTRQSFPQRNRIVAGLAKGILVAEAAKGSGALMTVDFATEFGRLVFAVPGRIDNPSAGGANFLIQNGAKLVTDIDDILEEFEYLLPPKPEGREDPEVSKPQVQLNDEERQILDSLGRSEVTQDEVIRSTGMTASAVATSLLTLEMKRQVVSLPGRKVRKTG